jgi:hypothetical protein
VLKVYARIGTPLSTLASKIPENLEMPDFDGVRDSLVIRYRL